MRSTFHVPLSQLLSLSCSSGSCCQAQCKSFRLDLVGTRKLGRGEVVFIQPQPVMEQKLRLGSPFRISILGHMPAPTWPSILPQERARALTEARDPSPPCLILGQPSRNALHCNHLCYQGAQRLSRLSCSRKWEYKATGSMAQYHRVTGTGHKERAAVGRKDR